MKRHHLLGVSLGVLSVSMLLAGIFGCGDDDKKEFNKPPEVQVTASPQGTVAEGTDCVFTWVSTDPDGSVVAYYYDLDNDKPTTMVTANTVTLKDVGVGTHTFYIQAQDDKDARSEVESVEFAVAVAVPSCSVVPAALDFGSVEVGGLETRSFVITNDGSSTLQGSVSQINPAFHIVQGGGGYTLDPGGALLVSVTFIPTSAGIQTTMVEVGDAACSDLTCTGQGASSAGTEYNDNVFFADHWPMDLISTALGSYAFILNGAAPELMAGDIIVGVGEDLVAYMRKVVSVDTTEGEMILETVQATFAEVFKNKAVSAQMPLTFDLPGVDGFLADGVELTPNGLRWDSFRLAVPGLGYVSLDDAYVSFEGLSWDGGFDIEDASVVEFRNLIHTGVAFGFDLSAGLDLASAAPGASTIKAPEVKVYSGKKAQTTEICPDPIPCSPCVNESAECDDLPILEQAACRADAWARFLVCEGLCVDGYTQLPCLELCHDITYTVYLGAEFDFPGLPGAGQAFASSAAPTDFHFDGFDGGVIIDAGTQFQNSVWGVVNQFAEMSGGSHPPLPPAFVDVTFRPYVVLVIKDRVSLCNQIIETPSEVLETRIEYSFVVSTSSELTKWCYEVGASRKVEFVEGPNTSLYEQYLDESLFLGWEPAWLDADSWRVYRGCRSWLPSTSK